MKRLIVGLLSLGLIGCPDYEAQTFWVQASVAPEESCTVNPGGGSAQLTLQSGVVDLSINRFGYNIFLSIANNLPLSSQVHGLGAAQTFLNNNDINVQGAEISYSAAGLDVTLPSGVFQVLPIGLKSGEKGVAAFNIMPSEIINLLKQSNFLVGTKAIRDPYIKECFETVLGESADWKDVPLGGREATVMIKLVLEGTLADGSLVKSNEFRYPVKVCNGCLITPQVDACTITQYFDEESIPDYIKPTLCQKLPCVIGQDQCFDARLCFNMNAHVEEPVVEKLLACANNPAFPSPAAGLTDSNACLGSVTPWTGALGTESATRLSQLLTRYSYERYDAYCLLQHESPTWGSQ